MKTLITKTNKLWNKYNTHVLAFLFTCFFMTAFTIVFLEIINQAFVTN
jgi:hypothetical protein